MSAKGLKVFLLSLASLGCGLVDSDTDTFVIRVDSVSAPAAIAPADTITVRFFGSIGPNGCYSLVDAPTTRTPALLEVRFNGKRVDALCIQTPIFLDHTQRLVPPFVDPFTIRVLQPDGATLEHIVRVQ